MFPPKGISRQQFGEIRAEKIEGKAFYSAAKIFILSLLISLEGVAHGADSDMVVPVESEQCFRSIADTIPMIADRAPLTSADGHGAGLASSPDGLVAALRRRSPLNVSL
jgi:hypothetical protein